MLSQVNAVIAAVKSFAQDNSIEFIEGTTDARSFLDEKSVSGIAEFITSQVMNKEVQFSENAWSKYDTRQKVYGYVKSMVKNHLKKSLKLNGGEPYRPTNPGSRTGQSNPEIKNLKACIAKLKSDGADAETIGKFESALEAKVAEYKASKQPQVEVDESLLSDELKALLS